MTEQDAGSQLTDMIQHWQNLKNQAETGELRMDTELGTQLKNHVGALAKQLEERVQQAGNLQYVTGFGGLRSAQDLQQKFSNKATVDEDSALNRLKQAIDIAKLMEQTYLLAIRQIEETDASVAVALGNAGAPQ